MISRRSQLQTFDLQEETFEFSSVMEWHNLFKLNGCRSTFYIVRKLSFRLLIKGFQPSRMFPSIFSWLIWKRFLNFAIKSEHSVRKYDCSVELLRAKNIVNISLQLPKKLLRL